MKKHLKLLILYFLVIYSTAKSQTWSAVGTGVNNRVNAMAVYNGSLIVGGNFTNAGGNNVNYIAKWNGTNWSTLGSGMSNFVNAMAVYNGELYVGGDFTSASGVPVYYIAKWNGTNWSSVANGMNLPVKALTVYNGNLYVGGDFTTVNGNNTIQYIAKWNGTSWSGVSSGVNSTVTALGVHNNELYVGGNFSMAGTVTAYNMAKYNGTIWASTGAAWVGALPAYAITSFNSNMVAGGAFYSANYISQYNGSAWSPISSGVNNNVRALSIYNLDLYAGGDFTSASGTSANKIAKWNGTSWSNLGTGVNNNVYSLVVYNSSLYVGGDFTIAGGISATGIASWNINTTNLTDNSTLVKDFNLFPNPSNNELTLTTTTNLVGSVYKIVDYTGKLILTGTINSETLKINTSELPAGIYMLQAGQNNLSSQKFIKQ